jgi:hypothetical protein
MHPDRPKEVTMSFEFRLFRKGTPLAALAATLAVAAPAQAIPSHLDGIHPSSSPVNARGTDVAAADQQSPRTPGGRHAARPKTPSDVTAALAQERYYTSYGQDVEPYHFPPLISEQEKQVLASRGLGAPTPPLNANLSAQNTPAADDAFDWGAAGVGAGTVGGLIVLAAGLGLTRRARVSSKPRLS